MALLVGGLRVLGAKCRAVNPRRFQRPQTLTNDFFVDLLDTSTY